MLQIGTYWFGLKRLEPGIIWYRLQLGLVQLITYVGRGLWRDVDVEEGEEGIG